MKLCLQNQPYLHLQYIIWWTELTLWFNFWLDKFNSYLLSSQLQCLAFSTTLGNLSRCNRIIFMKKKNGFTSLGYVTTFQLISIDTASFCSFCLTLNIIWHLIQQNQWMMIFVYHDNMLSEIFQYVMRHWLTLEIDCIPLENHWQWHR